MSAFVVAMRHKLHITSTTNTTNERTVRYRSGNLNIITTESKTKMKVVDQKERSI